MRRITLTSRLRVCPRVARKAAQVFSLLTLSTLLSLQACQGITVVGDSAKYRYVSEVLDNGQLLIVIAATDRLRESEEEIVYRLRPAKFRHHPNRYFPSKAIPIGSVRIDRISGERAWASLLEGDAQVGNFIRIEND